MLEEVGFEWDSHEAKWQQMYGVLLAYKEKHGHCHVPYKFVTADGQKLGRWVNTQRQAYKLKNRKPKSDKE